MTDKIYVLYRDFGYEGYSEPQAVWLGKPSASQLQKVSGWMILDEVDADYLVSNGSSTDWILEEFDLRVGDST